MIVYSCYNRIFTNTTAKSAFKSLCRFVTLFLITNLTFSLVQSIRIEEQKDNLEEFLKYIVLRYLWAGYFCVIVVFILKLFLQTVKLGCFIYLCVVLETILLLFQYKLGNTEIDRHFLSVFFGIMLQWAIKVDVLLNKYAEDIKQNGAIRLKFFCLVKHFKPSALHVI